MKIQSARGDVGAVVNGGRSVGVQNGGFGSDRCTVERGFSRVRLWGIASKSNAIRT